MTLLVVFAPLLVLCIAFEICRTLAFLRRAHRHDGRVVRLGYEPYMDSFLYATVQFNRGTEGSHEVDVVVSEISPVKVGDRVTILYDSLQNEGRLDTSWRVWGPFPILMVIVLSMLLFVILSRMR